MFLLTWVILSLSLAPLYVFQDTPLVEDFLAASRFDSLYIRAFANAYPAEIAFFLSLFAPRLLFVIAVIRVLQKYQFRGGPLKPSRGLLLASLCLGTVSAFFDYGPAFFACVYLGSYVLGRSSQRTPSAILVIGCIVLAIYLLKIPRGTSVSIVATFLIGRGRLDRASLLLIIGTLIFTIILTTFLKFGSSDAIFANPFDRLSVFNQFKIYLWGDAAAFSAERPVTVDLIASMPLVRNFFPQLSESALFDMVTRGSLGGLAVSPEIRGLGFWEGEYWVYIDLAVSYGLIWLALKAVVLRLPNGFDVVTFIMPLLIQFDSINVAAATVQIILISTIIIVLDKSWSPTATLAWLKVVPGGQPKRNQ